MRYDTVLTIRLKEDDAAWLETTSEKHLVSSSKLVRLGIAMIRAAWADKPELKEDPKKYGVLR
jgi:hypothetical protein